MVFKTFSELGALLECSDQFRDIATSSEQRVKGHKTRHFSQALDGGQLAIDPAIAQAA